MERPEAAARVVEHAVEDDPHPALVGPVEQLAQGVVTAEQRVDREVVVRVISMIRGRLEDRRHVDRGHAQVDEVVQVFGDAEQVAALESVDVVGGVSHGSRSPGLGTRSLAAKRSGKIW